MNGLRAKHDVSILVVLRKTHPESLINNYKRLEYNIKNNKSKENSSKDRCFADLYNM